MISSSGGFYTGGSLMRCEAFYDGTLMHEMTYIPWCVGTSISSFHI